MLASSVTEGEEKITPDRTRIASQINAAIPTRASFQWFDFKKLPVGPGASPVSQRRPARWAGAGIWGKPGGDLGAQSVPSCPPVCPQNLGQTRGARVGWLTYDDLLAPGQSKNRLRGAARFGLYLVQQSLLLFTSQQTQYDKHPQQRCAAQGDIYN